MASSSSATLLLFLRQQSVVLVRHTKMASSSPSKARGGHTKITSLASSKKTKIASLASSKKTKMASLASQTKCRTCSLATLALLEDKKLGWFLLPFYLYTPSCEASVGKGEETLPPQDPHTKCREKKEGFANKECRGGLAANDLLTLKREN